MTHAGDELGDADYSDIANEQLDALERGQDPDLYDAVLDAIKMIFEKPSMARSLSTGVTSEDGIRMRFAVPGYLEYKVFWSTDGPRIDAVFRYP
jgi:hypothetical protein